MRFNIKGLYVITDTSNISSEIMFARTKEILRAGAKLLQYRNKQADASTRIREAKKLHELCRQYSVPLIINDDVKLASQVDADGVHLGKDDSSIVAAKAQLKSEAIIGCSCYNDFGNAEQAAKSGADYIAFGAFYPSPTKPEAVHATPDIIQTAKQKFKLPVVAIGGITPENGQSLIAAGADMLAVVSGLYNSETSFTTTMKYINLFQESMRQ